MCHNRGRRCAQGIISIRQSSSVPAMSPGPGAARESGCEWYVPTISWPRTRTASCFDRTCRASNTKRPGRLAALRIGTSSSAYPESTSRPHTSRLFRLATTRASRVVICNCSRFSLRTAIRRGGMVTTITCRHRTAQRQSAPDWHPAPLLLSASMRRAQRPSAPRAPSSRSGGGPSGSGGASRRGRGRRPSRRGMRAACRSRGCARLRRRCG